MIQEVNSFVRGWVAYYRYASCKGHLESLDQWIRHRLRCCLLSQWKRRWTIVQNLVALGVKRWKAWTTASSGKGWWRLSNSPTIHQALSNKWFEDQGLVSMLHQHQRLNHQRKPPDT